MQAQAKAMKSNWLEFCGRGSVCEEAPGRRTRAEYSRVQRGIRGPITEQMCERYNYAQLRPRGRAGEH